jgi:hypothetical protein
MRWHPSYPDGVRHRILSISQIKVTLLLLIYLVTHIVRDGHHVHAKDWKHYFQ